MVNMKMRGAWFIETTEQEAEKTQRQDMWDIFKLLCHKEALLNVV